MVLGKNAPKHVARATTTKLPPLRALRVRKPDQTQQNPCLAVMSSVLGCWASSGYTTSGCAAFEEQLRACMDKKRAPDNKKNTINSQLSKFYPQMIGPHKRK